ncbi:hypothetical protein [Actinomadura sp. 6N118]|uniref:hypothetical protein n=1 Tax=Actinomadura sp. 6N118 TaxID=3375151 RepID=UPI0037BE4C89
MRWRSGLFWRGRDRNHTPVRARRLGARHRCSHYPGSRHLRTGQLRTGQLCTRHLCA